MKQKTLREDAHSREAETCRKRPRSARECAKAHSFLTEINKKNGEGYQEGTAVQQGPHVSVIRFFHKEK